MTWNPATAPKADIRALVEACIAHGVCHLQYPHGDPLPLTTIRSRIYNGTTGELVCCGKWFKHQYRYEKGTGWKCQRPECGKVKAGQPHK